jgi:branched-chain amino acid transport system ATP-binding protein
LTPTQPILKVENLQVNYGDFRAIEGASLEVEGGKIVSVIGANGSGKSTLLNAICGMLKPVSGKVFFEGKPITGMRPDKLVTMGISLVPEGGQVFQSLTILENLLMGAYIPSARKNRNELLKKVYRLFPVLEEKATQLAGNLSGGQRQMLAVGRALMSNPKLIIFDEISLGLAPTVIKDIYAQIKLINQEGTTIILVEQDVRRSLKTSDVSYILLNGRIVLSGKSKELTADDVRSAYFGV